MKKGLFTLSCLLIILNVYAQEKTSKSGDFNLGVGLGIPYGIMGIGADFAIIPNINLHGSIGSVWLNGITYNVGVDVYFRDHNKVWRPKAIILYGVNGVIEGEPSSYFETKFTT